MWKLLHKIFGWDYISVKLEEKYIILRVRKLDSSLLYVEYRRILYQVKLCGILLYEPNPVQYIPLTFKLDYTSFTPASLEGLELWILPGECLRLPTSSSFFFS